MTKDDYIRFIQTCTLLTYDLRERLLSQAQELTEEQRSEIVEQLSEVN